MEAEGQIESVEQTQKSPQGAAKRWATEIRSAKENRRTFREQGKKAIARFLDERDGSGGRKSRLNLFHSDVNTLRSMLLGRVPQVDVDRKFHDSQDDVARVGAEMMERVLSPYSVNEPYVVALKHAIEDWTLPGLGVARVRYEPGEEQVEPGKPALKKTRPNPETGEDEEYEAAPEVPEVRKRPREDAETVYVYWEDFLWGPSRTWHEVPWVAFGAPMRERPFVERFGDGLWELAPKKAATKGEDEKAGDDDQKQVWAEVYVWEIWEKESRKVRWYVEGMDRLLDDKPDPFGLEGFYPCPRPLIANATTTKLMPKPDLELANDIYDEIDTATERIHLLQKAAKLVGVYDATQEEIPRLVDEACENDLVPVESWLSLMDKGGLAAVVQFMPLDQIVKMIELLTAQRQNTMALLHQVTGLSDVVRGQQDRAETATTSKIKAGFASTRVQTSQDEVARFASDLQSLRAEIVAKHFDDATILARSNVMRTKDAEFAQKAVALIKDEFSEYRIQVRPESMSLPDTAQVKQTRIEILQTLGGYFQQMLPFLQAAGAGGPEAIKSATNFVLDGGEWLVSGLRGSSELEAAFDSFRADLQKIAAQPPPPPQPNPALQVEQAKAQAAGVKAQADIQKTQMGMQATKLETAAHVIKAKADIQRAQTEAALHPPVPAPMPVPGGGIPGVA